MTYEEQKQQKIDEAIKQKIKRLDKTSASILVSWAINNAVNTISEKDKEEFVFNSLIERIKERYPFFIDLYRDWMLENVIEVDGKDIKQWNEKKQELYNQDSKLEEVKRENI